MTDEDRGINYVDDDHEEMSLQDLTDIRSSDQNYTQWRYDCATAEEYSAGNQFTFDDIEAASANGITLTIANYVKPILDDINGIQESVMTSWKVRGENPENDDLYNALSHKLFEAAKVTNVHRARLRAYASQVNVGIGWMEVGRQANPLLGEYLAEDVPWREMFFDMRARRADLEDAGYIHRVRTFHKDRIKKQFSHVEGIDWAVDTAPTPARMQWMNIEPPQNYRALPWRRGRDYPITYQNTPKDADLRTLEEVWRPVYLEGLFAKLPNGKVVLYDEKNSMLSMMVKYGIAKLVEAPYTRWRCALWAGDFKINDCWSPYPWRGHPYIAFWGYREGMTMVPYGVTRGLVSLQDEINSAAAKFHFGMDAVRIYIEEGALSESMSLDEVIAQAANKRGVFILKQGKIDKIKIDHHFQLNEQNFKRAQDAKADMRAVSMASALNPANINGAPADPQMLSAMTLRALANLGEIPGNYREGSELVGDRMIELINEDIAEQGNVEITYNHPTRGIRKVQFQTEIGFTAEHGRIINNDVTLLRCDVGLDEVPHTATYRAQQLSDNMKMAQSCPPEAVEARTMLMANVVKLSDVPHGNEVGQHMLEQAGLVPPSTPEAAKELQQKQQEAQQQREIGIEDALAQIGHRKAQTTKLLSDAQLKQAMAQSAAMDLKDPQYEAVNRNLLLERTAVQNRRTAAQADKIEKELNALPPMVPAPLPIPEHW
jgi:hypothetical protein